MPSSSVVNKCARVLDILVGAPNPPVFAQVVECSGFAKSSAHRILAVLLSEGLAEYCAHDKTYRPGPKLMQWVAHIWRNTDIRRAAHGQLEALRDACGHNVALAVQEENSVLYISTADSYPVRFAPKVGERASLHCTAVGKILLAYLEPAQRKIILNKIVLDKSTERSIRSRTALAKELQKVRRRGIAFNDREEFMQICGIAMPIFDMQAEAPGSICIWSLAKRADINALRELSPLLKQTAELISTRLGGKYG